MSNTRKGTGTGSGQQRSACKKPNAQPSHKQGRPHDLRRAREKRVEKWRLRMREEAARVQARRGGNADLTTAADARVLLSEARERRTAKVLETMRARFAASMARRELLAAKASEEKSRARRERPN